MYTLIVVLEEVSIPEFLMAFCNILAQLVLMNDMKEAINASLIIDLVSHPRNKVEQIS